MLLFLKAKERFDELADHSCFCTKDFEEMIEGVEGKGEGGSEWGWLVSYLSYSICLCEGSKSNINDYAEAETDQSKYLA